MHAYLKDFSVDHFQGLGSFTLVKYFAWVWLLLIIWRFELYIPFFQSMGGWSVCYAIIFQMKAFYFFRNLFLSKPRCSNACSRCFRCFIDGYSWFSRWRSWCFMIMFLFAVSFSNRNLLLQRLKWTRSSYRIYGGCSGGCGIFEVADFSVWNFLNFKIVFQNTH